MVNAGIGMVNTRIGIVNTRFGRVNTRPCVVAYPVLRRGGRGRTWIVWTVGVATCAAVVAGFAWLYRPIAPLLTPDAGNLNRLGSMTLAFVAICLVGCLGCAFLGFVRRTVTLAGAAPWIVGFVLFCVELRFGLESMTNTDRLFRVDVDRVLVRLWPERAMVVASGLALVVARFPGRKALRRIARDWKAAARAGGFALAVAFVVLAEPYAQDARVFVVERFAPLAGVTAVDRCTPLSFDTPRLSDMAWGKHPATQGYLEWFVDDAQRPLWLASALGVRDSSHDDGSRDRRLAIEAAIETRVASVRGVLQGAALADYDIVVVTQRIVALNARTIAGLGRLQALCDYGTIHLSLDQTTPLVDPEWTLADAIVASRDHRVRA